MNNKKTGFVAVVGRANVGKSTIINAIIGQKISIISQKPQTTRYKISAVYNDEESQIVFVDTPGFHKAQSKLGEHMVRSTVSSLEGVDLVVMVADSIQISDTTKQLFNMVKNTDAPSIFVINKTDKFSPEKFTYLYDKIKDMNIFDKVTGMAANTGRGVDDLIGYIKKLLPHGPVYYPDDHLTDETERNIAAELIREKALKYLDQEIPHGIMVEIANMKIRPSGDIVDIQANIITEKKSHKPIIIGKGGRKLKGIGRSAREDIEEMLGIKVNLQLFVKVREGWRDNQNLLRSYGFKK